MKCRVKNRLVVFESATILGQIPGEKRRSSLVTGAGLWAGADNGTVSRRRGALAPNLVAARKSSSHKPAWTAIANQRLLIIWTSRGIIPRSFAQNKTDRAQ